MRSEIKHKDVRILIQRRFTGLFSFFLKKLNFLSLGLIK